MYYLVTKQKWAGDNRSFGTEDNPLRYLVVLVTNGENSSPPVASDIFESPECDFAPGSILLDPEHGEKAMYNGTDWMFWSGDSGEDTK